MVLNGKIKFRLNIRKKHAFCKDGDTPEQFAQTIWGCPSPGSIQSQVGALSSWVW